MEGVPEHSFAYFFITFLLKTCLETVKSQMKDLNLKNYEEKPEEFQFKAKRAKFQLSHVKELEIVLPKSDSLPAGWMVGMQGKKKVTYINIIIYNIIVKVLYMFLQISMSEIDFFVRDRNAKELQLKEDYKIYPPRFQVEISCSSSAQPDQIKIQFKGAMTDLMFDTRYNVKHIHCICLTVRIQILCNMQ